MPLTATRTPFVTKAPRLWPAAPVARRSTIVAPFGTSRPSGPSASRSRARSRSPEIRAPTARSAVVSVAERTTGAVVSRVASVAIAGASARARRSSSGLAVGASASRPTTRGAVARPAGRRHGGASTNDPRSRAASSTTASRSVLPTASATLRNPSAASSRRTSSARAVKNATTCSGVPVNFARRSVALGRDPGGAGVEVALPRHVAADGHEGGRAEAELLGAEERSDDHVTAGLQAAVGPQRDPVAQALADAAPGAPPRGRAPRAPRRA